MKLASTLFKHIKINIYAIELIDKQQSPYRSIYNLKAIELETLKTYIKTKLAHNFIKYFKFLVKASIFL